MKWFDEIKFIYLALLHYLPLTHVLKKFQEVVYEFEVMPQILPRLRIGSDLVDGVDNFLNNFPSILWTADATLVWFCNEFCVFWSFAEIANAQAVNKCLASCCFNETAIWVISSLELINDFLFRYSDISANGHLAGCVNVKWSKNVY